MRAIFGLILSMLLAAPATGEWRQARTDHFVLTIDDSEANARAFATRLERFDAALRRLYAIREKAGRDIRPISIYALDPDTFQKTCGCPFTLGYYSQRVGGSVIFTQYIRGDDKKAKQGALTSQAVLLHEYSHHFFFSGFPIASQYWFAEGFAELNANASFEPDGGVVIGYPANYRGGALLYGSTLTPKQLFDPYRYGFGQDIDLVYGRGWLLTHYLMLNPARRGQLSTYLTALNNGTASLDAAALAFGDLKKLNAALDAYSRGRLLPPLRIAPASGDIAVSVTTLSPGQAAMLPVHALVTSGVTKNARNRIASRGAKIAGRFPDDAVVQAQWADAELLADRLDEADLAADAALKAKPDMVDALATKGAIAIRRATKANSGPEAWAAARAWLLKANRLDPDAVMPLYLYYESFVAAKAKPTPGAIKGLLRAAVLAPESEVVRLSVVRQLLDQSDGAGARALLMPIAFSPHRPAKKDPARDALALIDGGKLDAAKIALTPTPDEDE